MTHRHTQTDIHPDRVRVSVCRLWHRHLSFSFSLDHLAHSCLQIPLQILHPPRPPSCLSVCFSVYYSIFGVFCDQPFNSFLINNCQWIKLRYGIINMKASSIIVTSLDVRAFLINILFRNSRYIFIVIIIIDFHVIIIFILVFIVIIIIVTFTIFFNIFIVFVIFKFFKSSLSFF